MVNITFWERLRQSFLQLRSDCAINPPLNPAGRLTALWIAVPEPGSWRLQLHRESKDGFGVKDRFNWHAESAAARLGCEEDDALSFWLNRLSRDAPGAFIRVQNIAGGPDDADMEYSRELLDVCFLSAEYCRKCEAEEIQTATAGGTASMETESNMALKYSQAKQAARAYFESHAEAGMHSCADASTFKRLLEDLEVNARDIYLADKNPAWDGIGPSRDIQTGRTWFEPREQELLAEKREYEKNLAYLNSRFPIRRKLWLERYAREGGAKNKSIPKPLEDPVEVREAAKKLLLVGPDDAELQIYLDRERYVWRIRNGGLQSTGELRLELYSTESFDAVKGAFRAPDFLNFRWPRQHEVPAGDVSPELTFLRFDGHDLRLWNHDETPALPWPSVDQTRMRRWRLTTRVMGLSNAWLAKLDVRWTRGTPHFELMEYGGKIQPDGEWSERQMRGSEAKETARASLDREACQRNDQAMDTDRVPRETPAPNLVDSVSPDDPNYLLVRKGFLQSWADSHGLVADAFEGHVSISDFVDACVRTFDQGAQIHVDFKDSIPESAKCHEIDVMTSESIRLFNDSLSPEAERLGTEEVKAAIDEYYRQINAIAFRAKQKLMKAALAETNSAPQKLLDSGAELISRKSNGDVQDLLTMDSGPMIDTQAGSIRRLRAKVISNQISSEDALHQLRAIAKDERFAVKLRADIHDELDRVLGGAQDSASVVLRMALGQESEELRLDATLKIIDRILSTPAMKDYRAAKRHGEKCADLRQRSANTIYQLKPDAAPAPSETETLGTSVPVEVPSPEEVVRRLSPKDSQVHDLVGEENFRTLRNADIMRDRAMGKALRQHFNFKRGADATKCCFDRIRKAKSYPLSKDIAKKRSRDNSRTVTDGQV